MDHGDESTSDGIRFKCTMYEHGLSVDGAFDHGRRGSSWAPFGMLVYTIRRERLHELHGEGQHRHTRFPNRNVRPPTKSSIPVRPQAPTLTARTASTVPYKGRYHC